MYDIQCDFVCIYIYIIHTYVRICHTREYPEYGTHFTVGYLFVFSLCVHNVQIRNVWPAVSSTCMHTCKKHKSSGTGARICSHTYVHTSAGMVATSRMSLSVWRYDTYIPMHTNVCVCVYTHTLYRFTCACTHIPERTCQKCTRMYSISSVCINAQICCRIYTRQMNAHQCRIIFTCTTIH